MENQEDGGNFYSKKVSGLVLRVKVQSDSRAQTPRTPRTPREDDEEVITKVQVCTEFSTIRNWSITTH